MSEKKKQDPDINIIKDLTTSEDGPSHTSKRSGHRHHRHHKVDSEEDSEKRRKKRGRQKDGTDSGESSTPSTSRRHRDCSEIRIDPHGSFSQSSPSSPLQRRKKSAHILLGSINTSGNGSMGPDTPISSLKVLKSPDSLQQRRVPPTITTQPLLNPLSPSAAPGVKHKRVVIGIERLRPQQERKCLSPSSSPQTLLQPSTGFKTLSSSTKSNSFKLRTPSPTVFRTGELGGNTATAYGITGSGSGGIDGKGNSTTGKNMKRLSVYDLKQTTLSENMLQQSSTPKIRNLKLQPINMTGTSPKRPTIVQQTRVHGVASGIGTTAGIGGSGGVMGVGVNMGSPSPMVNFNSRRKRVQSEIFNKDDLMRSFGESWILLLNKCEVYVNMKTLSLVTTFEIQVSKSIAKPWKIVKSFKQFYELDVELRYALASTSIPKLPNKSVFKLEFGENAPDSKVKELGTYLDEISQNSKITESQAFSSWVKEGSDIVRTLGLKRPDVYGYLNLVITHTRKVRKLVVLASPILFFYDSDISEFLDSKKQAIWLGHAKLKLLGGGSNVFVVQAKNGGFFVLEASENDAGNWIKKLKEAIKETTLSLEPKHTWKKASPYKTSEHSSGDENSFTGDETQDNSNSIRSTSSIYGEDSEDPEDVFEAGENMSDSLEYDKDGSLTPGTSETHRVKIFMEKFGPAKRDVDISLGRAVAVLKEAKKNPERAGDTKFIHYADRLIRRFERIVRSSPKDLITSDMLRKAVLSLQKFRKKYESVVPPKALYDLSHLSRIVEGQNELTHTGERRKRDLARTYSHSAIFSSPPKIVQDEEDLELLKKARDKPIPHYSHKYNYSTLPSFSHSAFDLPHLQLTDESRSSEDDEIHNSKRRGSIANGANTSSTDSCTDGDKEGEEGEHESEGSKKRRKKKSRRRKKRREYDSDAQCSDDNELEESMLSKVNYIINSDEEEEGDSQTCEDEIRLKQDRSLIMCRICEEEYPRYLLQEHTEYCAYIESLVSGDMACDTRIELLVNSLSEQKENQESQYSNMDTSPYTKVIIIGRAVSRLQYGSEDAMSRCFNLLSELHWYLDNGSYDLLLLAFGKKLIKVIEEKYSVMKEFLRVHTKGIVSTSQSGTTPSLSGASPTTSLLSTPSSNAKKQRKKGNFWGMLMFMKPGRVETETIRAINSAYSSRIKIEDFKLIKKISSGAYGKVFLARKNKTNDLYAVKVLKKEDTLRKNMTDNVIAERKILSSINNPFVVNLYYAFQNKKYLYLVMEYCPGGDVGTLLKNLGAFDLDMARIYAAETVLALESMHKLNFVHRDLKPDNLLISATGHVVLTDFGLSTWGVMMGDSSKSSKAQSQPQQQQQQQQEQQQEHRIFGTPDYLAPEILLGTGHGPEVDWWALGAMVFEFITSVPPFNDDSPEKIFDNIMNMRIPWPSEEDGFPPVARDFIEKLLVPDYEKRLGHNGAGEIKEHPFFEGINWDTLIYESREDIFVPNVENPEDTSYFEDHGSVNDLEPGQVREVNSSEEMREMEAETAAMMSVEAAYEDYENQRKQKKYSKDVRDEDDDFSDFEYTNTELIKKKTLELAINVNDDEVLDEGIDDIENIIGNDNDDEIIENDRVDGLMNTDD